MAAWVAWGRVPEAFWDHFEAILGRFSDQGGDDMVEFTWPSDAINNRQDKWEYHPMLEVGGGLNPSSRDLEGYGVGRSWKDEGMRVDTEALNHLSPRGLVGFS